MTPEQQALERKQEAYFRGQLNRIHRETDRLFFYCLIIQWAICVFTAISLTPLTWTGRLSSIHPHVWAAVLFGGALAAFPVYLTIRMPGATITRQSVAIGQMLMGALLIHLTGGRIETHFHVFGSLAFLSFYRDWKVLASASAVVVVDHLLRGFLWPESIYGTITAPVWRTLEHGGWVIVEDAFLFIAMRQSLREMQDTARKRARLEMLNDEVESRVIQRTSELAESEQRFRMLSATAPVGIFQTDSKGNLFYSNQRWSEISGLSEEESFGDRWLKCVFPEDAERVRKEWLSAVHAGREFLCEYRIITTSGEVHWILSRAKAMFTPTGEFAGHVGTVEDTTFRKLHEEELSQARDAALESVRLKSEFLANVSHEIRTPMNAIIGMTGLLLDTPLDTQQKKLATTVYKSAETLLTLLNDILDFSKIEAGKLHFEEDDFDLQETVENTLDLLADSAHSKNLELIGFLKPGTPRYLRGDAGRLRQVLVNLLHNAIKFTDEGEVVLSISLEHQNQTDAFLRFEVRDTGIGIPAETQGKLFEAFTQADGSGSWKYGGTGLGLAISKRLVELMAGRIGIVSEPGKGSTFWFTARFRTSTPVSTEAVIQKNLLHGWRVLTVDDNAANAEMLKHQLQALGMRSNHAYHAKEALELLNQSLQEKDPYRLVILDMQMPEVTGLSLASQIRADPRFIDLRLIMLTSLGTRLDPRSLREAGILECLLKPVKQAKFVECIARVFSDITGEPKRNQDSPSENDVPLHGLNGLRILVAEDNQVNQKVVLALLEKLGYRADVAANGQEVLHVYDSSIDKPYDVIFMDCQMPEMDGYAATRCIRERELHSGKHVHIIALTANSMNGDRDLCIAAGMDDYIAKPLRKNDLILSLNRFAEKRVRPRALA